MDGIYGLFRIEFGMSLSNGLLCLQHPVSFDQIR